MRHRAPRLLAATAAMAALLLLVEPLVYPWLDGGLAPRVAGLTLLIAPAALCYFGCTFLFGAFRPAELRAVVSLDDRALRDSGVSLAEIGHAVRYGRD